MWSYNHDPYLCHYGVKGMKWGVRRYQNPDGSLTAKGVKKYARKSYAQDAYDSNKSAVGKAYDKVTGAHRIAGKMKYDLSSAKNNRERADQYVKEKVSKNKAENYSDKQRVRDRKIYGKGAERRINKRMLKGEGIQSARHNEVVRKKRIEDGKAIAARVATGALVLGGAAAVTKALQNKGFGKNIADNVVAGEVVNIGREVIGAIFR